VRKQALVLFKLLSANGCLDYARKGAAAETLRVPGPTIGTGALN